MWIVSMRFTSQLDEADQEKISRGGLQKFREVDGLRQKYYVRNHDDGTVGGIYLFDSREAAEAYVAGPIVAGVGDRFAVQGDVRIEKLEVMLTLDEH